MFDLGSFLNLSNYPSVIVSNILLPNSYENFSNLNILVS